MEGIVNGKTLRKIGPTLPFTFQFNRNLKPENWADMDQVLQHHQLLKDVFQWSMENKRFNVSSNWKKLGRLPGDMSQVDIFQGTFGNHQRL
ncbi:hypothetical protein O181_079168 [Austropuccinia psidii MF-1]|uniref:Uncharacterized protein n=1 Tax=Austropuccinia psidii MF-1 TaxID=1389203 RepID=A0A9Q3IFC6_9BASI|nr:hypothetical protein [Austropuccinia psidii MF-1]